MSDEIECAIMNTMMAEEAISSVEIENGAMEPKERYILKMSMTFPKTDKEVWASVYDERLKE